MFKSVSLPKTYSLALYLSVVSCVAFIILYIFKGPLFIVYQARFFLVCYICVIIPLIKSQTRWMSSIMLFIFTFVLFYLSRIIASFFDENFLIDSNKYIFYSFSNDTITSILCFFGISITAVVIGFLLSYIKYRPINVGKPIKLISSNSKSRNLKLLIISCIFITIPGTIYKSLFDLYLIFQYGYMILYMDLPEVAPAWARISWGGFYLIFPLLLIFCNNKSFFKKIVIFYFAINLISFIKGTRGELILPIIFFTWFYFNNFSKKDISLNKVFLIIVIVAILASIMLLTRGSTLSFDLGLILQMLFLSQGVQYVFIGNYIDYSNAFAHKTRWYILYPIVAKLLWFFDPTYSHGKTAKLAEVTLSLDDQVMFSTNQDAYFQGAGYGSSYIAELDALGGITAILIGSILLGFCINWFEVKYKSNKYLILLSWFWIPALVWMPRGNYLIGPFFPIISIIILKVLMKFSSILSKTSYNHGLYK